MTERQKFIKPSIAVTEADHKSLSALAWAYMRTEPDLARDLIEELERAEVLPVGTYPDDLVSIGSTVSVFNVSSRLEQVNTLVLPEQADVLRARILHKHDENVGVAA